MSHCKSARNHCEGITHCFCDCDQCIGADEEAVLSGDNEAWDQENAERGYAN